MVSEEEVRSVHLSMCVQVILGTMYAGCIKAGVFTLLSHILPQRGVLPLQAGCNVGVAEGDATLFFGLSGSLRSVGARVE